MSPLSLFTRVRSLSTVRGIGLLIAAVVLSTQMTACAALVQRRAPVPERPALPELPAMPQVTEPPLRLPAFQTLWSPNFNSRKGARITAIVLHHTASSADARAIARYFQTREAQVSAHYVVDRDGSIIRCVPDEMRAWHAGPSHFAGENNVNDFSLGIEICNRGDSIEPYPAVQVAAVTRLIAHLTNRHGIPMDRVTRHRDVIVPRGIKVDPSDNFDFAGVVVAARHLLDDHAIWLAQRGDRRASWPVDTSTEGG
jgi:N-acetyl-anhydromuramyl-L-alanine amidase AmpD